MRLFGRWLVSGAVALVFAVACYPGADMVGFGIRTHEVAPAPGWLHVAHPRGGMPYIADEQGRMVILHGVIAAGLIDYWSGNDPKLLAPPPLFAIDPAAYEGGRCPENFATIRNPPLCQNDLVEMSRLGFDLLRLGLSWSLLEPSRGRYSRQYLDRIRQVVGWARTAGLRVILDMHQNSWGRYIGRSSPPPIPGGSVPALSDNSGAPAWATLSWHLPSEKFLGQREENPVVGAAFTSFWVNLEEVQDHYIEGLAFLAQAFKDDSTVLGYGLFNEPWQGFFDQPYFEDLLLFPFYRRALDALTGARDGVACPAGAPALPVCGYPDLGVHVRRQLFFVEPDHIREVTDFATHFPLPVSSYGNVVYGIHAYTHKFTFDALAGLDPSLYPFGGYDQSYDSAAAEAKAMNAALMVTEFGNETYEDSTLLANQLKAQERHLTGSIFWPWKENCAAATTWGVYAGVYGDAKDQRCSYERSSPDAAPKVQNGCLRAAKERLLARAWPRAAPAGFSYSYNPGDGSFAMRGRARAGTPEALVYLPPEVKGEASAEGAKLREEAMPDGSRLLHVAVSGDYTISVAAAPLALQGCPAGSG
jgi:hypothetical protein